MLRLKLRDSVTVAVPASLSAMTTYVLLEQEEWFEKEVNFLRRFLSPGMVVVDVGANHGVYSLPAAKLVGAEGRVYSYEPGSGARMLLEESKRINSLDNLEICSYAVSDGHGEGYLSFADSSELRALGSAGGGERVEVTCLDLESEKRNWSAVDFIKFDAEGHEERIFAGGKHLFETQSPLVMFEVKAADGVSNRLRQMFLSIGYRIFRQLVGQPLLVPQETSQPLDGYELNLFACKVDRADALAKKGLLIDEVLSWAPQNASDRSYESALDAFAVWRDATQLVSTRCAALHFALNCIRAVACRDCTVERASTWARIAWEWGARTEAFTALERAFQIARDKRPLLKERFWPAAARFDAGVPGIPPIFWFWIAAAEQCEIARAFSSFFGGSSSLLQWLCEQKLVSTEMVRRQTLLAAKGGQQPRLPDRLRVTAPDHVNAEVWLSGKISGVLT
jgi:FkbM family methyltransferase